MTERRRRKPKPVLMELKPVLLDEGDYINFSFSRQIVLPDGYEAWCKGEAGTKLRPGETVEDANKRLFEAVEIMLDTNIDSVLEDAV